MNENIIVIYEDEEIKVVFCPGRSDFAVITFGDMVSLADGVRFFADTPLKKLGFTAVGVMAKKTNWFPRANMHACAPCINRTLRDYETRVVYGGSMGGYAAIKYSRLLEASHVISLCPQWSLDSSECDGFNPGWESYYVEEMKGMGIRHNDVQGQVFIFVDPFETLDMFHLRRIIDKYPLAIIIKTPMIGHKITTVLAGTNKLSDLISASIDNDVNSLRVIGRNARLNSPIRKQNAFEAMKRRLPAIADKYLEKKYNQWFLLYNYEQWALLADSSTNHEFQHIIESFNNLKARPRSIIYQHLICSYLAQLARGKVAVMTSHKSILIYSISENSVFHKSGPRKKSDILVECLQDTEKASLSILVGETRFPLAVSEGGKLFVSPTIDGRGKSNYFTLEEREDGRFCIKSNNGYLCALPDGSIICNRSNADEWEMLNYLVTKLDN